MKDRKTADVVWFGVLLLATLLATKDLSAAQATQEQKKEDPGVFKVYWRDGLRADTADKTVQLTFGMRVMNDWAWMGGDDGVESKFGELEDGTEIRRARFELGGTFYERVEFRFQYDFGSGEPEAKDVYFGIRSIPHLGTLRVGHYKEPFSIEELTSSKFITFMERSLPNAFVPARNVGIAFNNTAFKERVAWAIGLFRDSDDFGFGQGDENYAVTGRLTGLPWYESDGEKLLHVGIGYSRRNPLDDKLRFRQRPETHLAPRFVDTGAFPAETLDLIGPEVALVYGPFSLQSEAVIAAVSSPGPDPTFSSFYIQGSYWLTGEHRAYRRSDGSFVRVNPKRSLTKEGGPGAWEFAVRYSRMDLNDPPVAGGVLDDLTLGLNWHLNPYARVMWNYVFADREDVGHANIFQVRFQVDF